MDVSVSIMAEVAVMKYPILDQVSDGSRSIVSLGNVNPQSCATLTRVAEVELNVSLIVSERPNYPSTQRARFEEPVMVIKDLTTRIDAEILGREPNFLQGIPGGSGVFVVLKDRDQEAFRVKD
jgi:hypothetical protein